ncbi:MAG: aminotransferase class V-fold PLP-dependent enzyme [Pseudomonadota bacterium]|nr:aminotransferase class V-fold PLP-dependent enzyme [Pseudomonadota bacterium]
MTIDIEKIRADTPGIGNVAHFNNAGASLMPTPVLDAQIDHLKLEASIGGYEAAAAAAERCEAIYASVAKLIHAEVEEIALVENATVAWDMAFYSLPFEKGDRILTAEAEYAANYIAYLQVARRAGAVVETIPSTNAGDVDTRALEDMIDERVKLISITHIPTNGGLVNPAAEIGRIANAHGITYLLDACQSVGQLPVDVGEIGCDILSATGRKYLRGPRGTGFLYVRKGLLETLEPPMIDLFAAKWVAPDRYELRPDARRFENWENNYAARLGLGVAVDYALDLGLETIWQRILDLSSNLRTRLSEVDGVELRDIGTVQGGIVTFTLDGVDSMAIKEVLKGQGINVSVSHPASTLLDATRRNLPPVVRASVHYYNAETEVERLVEAIGIIAAKRGA